MATTMASFEFVRWAGDAVFSGLIVDNNNIKVMAPSTCFSSPSSSKCNEDSFINSEENITDDNKIDESSFESFSLGSDIIIISCQSVEDSDISGIASEGGDDDDSDYVNSNSEVVVARVAVATDVIPMQTRRMEVLTMERKQMQAARWHLPQRQERNRLKLLLSKCQPCQFKKLTNNRPYE